MHDDDYDDWEEDDEDDGYVPCPHCGETMLEAAEYCPYCERWITSEDIPRKPWPLWMTALINDSYCISYAPSSLRMALAMASACWCMVTSDSASIMTRARASVPL